MLPTGHPLPRIALSLGEPGGIGPDLALLIAGESWPCELVAFGAAEVLRARADRLGLSIELVDFAPHRVIPHQPGRLVVRDVPVACPVTAGRSDARNAAGVLETITLAAHTCRDGRCDALVTAPVHKAAINEAGFPFTGHTEFLAQITGGTPVMLLAAPGLRVALATTHLPLAEVPAHITRAGLLSLLTLLDADLRIKFKLPNPRILVCGLNPHAGEGGYLGREEIDVITPALETLRAQGLSVEGPLPADTVFLPHNLERADAVLAMYHDQGLPVLKRLAFGRAVNITLGLPILRTSVDHGTAFDLAGTGRADPGSLKAALAMALELSTRSKTSP